MTPEANRLSAMAERVYEDLLKIIPAHPNKISVVVIPSILNESTNTGLINTAQASQDIDYGDPISTVGIELADGQVVSELKGSFFGSAVDMGLPDPKGFLVVSEIEIPAGSILITAEDVRGEISEFQWLVDHHRPIGRNGAGGFVLMCWPYYGDAEDTNEESLPPPAPDTGTEDDEFIIRS